MTEDQEIGDPSIDSGSKIFINKSKDKKIRSQKPLTKIVLRRLPPKMTEESFLEQVSPIPEHDYLCFAKPDPSISHNLYSRAYINFLSVEDIYLFRDKFDGYVFLDEKGVEYIGIVEYAPFQRIPKKKKKKDPKCNTIESDPLYQEFVESLTKEPEPDTQPKLEYSYPISDGNDKKMKSTPLLEYLAARKQDKRGRDERRRRENDKRKMRIERKIKDGTIMEDDVGDNEIKKIKPREWEKDKSRKDDAKSDKDGTVYESKTFKDQRKANLADKKKKYDDGVEEIEVKKDPRDQKSKKYSDSRKERAKEKEPKPSAKAAFEKPKLSNHDDIKPFTQLPHVRTDDLSKVTDGMDKKMKLDVSQPQPVARVRRNSVDSGPGPGPGRAPGEQAALTRQNSMDERRAPGGGGGGGGGSDDERDRGDDQRRADTRIRNKDRPSMVIYQPGMGRFSKQRLAKDKDPPTKVSDAEKKDT